MEKREWYRAVWRTLLLLAALNCTVAAQTPSSSVNVISVISFDYIHISETLASSSSMPTVTNKPENVFIVIGVSAGVSGAAILLCLVVAISWCLIYALRRRRIQSGRTLPRQRYLMSQHVVRLNDLPASAHDQPVPASSAAAMQGPQSAIYADPIRAISGCMTDEKTIRSPSPASHSLLEAHDKTCLLPANTSKEVHTYAVPLRKSPNLPVKDIPVSQHTKIPEHRSPIDPSLDYAYPLPLRRSPRPLASKERVQTASLPLLRSPPSSLPIHEYKSPKTSPLVGAMSALTSTLSSHAQQQTNQTASEHIYTEPWHETKLASSIEPAKHQHCELDKQDEPEYAVPDHELTITSKASAEIETNTSPESEGTTGYETACSDREASGNGGESEGTTGYETARTSYSDREATPVADDEEHH